MSKTKHWHFLLIFLILATELLASNPVDKLLENLKSRSRLSTKSSASNNVNYRLPTDTQPVHYELKLTTNIHLEDETDPDKFKFMGEVEITFEVLNETNEIVVHSKDQILEAAELRDDTGAVIPWADEELPLPELDTDFVRFKAVNVLVKDATYKLWIKYQGELRERVRRGFYKSFYETSDGRKVWFVGTQFQPIFARHAFPCYDEPGIRATFNVTVNHHQSLHALSNMPIREKVPE